MTEIIFKLSQYMTYPFVRYAIIAGILTALSSSLLGVTLVLKRYSFIGDGLSHVAFGAMAIATALNLVSDMIVIIPVTVISAVLLLQRGRHAKLKGDAAIAMLSAGALAVGYLIMNIFSSSPNVSGDICSTLFGSASILTLSETDVWLCAGLSILVFLIFLFFYNKIFSVTFDEEFSAAVGIHTEFYNFLTAVITAVVIVLAMNIVGSLLTSALIIFPTLASMRLFKSFKAVIICSALTSIFCTAIGMIISILAAAPVGSVIVIVYIVVFFLFTIISKLI